MVRTMVVALTALVLTVAGAGAGEEKIQIKKLQIAPAADGKEKSRKD